jgi:hypothetical protein
MRFMFMSGSGSRIAEQPGQPRVAPFSAQNGFTNPFDRSYRTHPIAVRIKREPVIRQITRHRYECVAHDRAERGDIAIALALMTLDRSLDQPVAIIGARVPYLARRFCQLSRLWWLRMWLPDVGLGGLQNAEGYRGSAHVVQTSACRRNMLAHARSDAQETSEFIERTTKPPG